MPTYHLLILGKVQGVFYRSGAKTVAEELEIAGWVRNTAEGNVEAVVTGKEDQLLKFISWCRKGPSKAVVTEVRVSELEEMKFSGFVIKR